VDAVPRQAQTHQSELKSSTLAPLDCPVGAVACVFSAHLIASGIATVGARMTLVDSDNPNDTVTAAVFSGYLSCSASFGPTSESGITEDQTISATSSWIASLLLPLSTVTCSGQMTVTTSG
jgi:hypothetical protein